MNPRKSLRATGEIAAARAALLAWYDAAARVLPWRVGPAQRAAGVRPDPYRVWLSEVMLQQTTTAAAGGYFARFLAAFPTVRTLADAPAEQVMTLWAGLGYYARARNLHACAKAVAAAGGAFPQDEQGLRALPGVGPYTAAAVAAIAFDRPANVVDGNVERVMARLFAHDQPLPAAKPALAAHAARFVTGHRPGDWAQALMDLGATVCTPKAPRCGLCPLADWCAGRAGGAPERLPAKAARAAKPVRHGVAFVLIGPAGVLARTRPDTGLLGGMLETPTTPWRAEPWLREEALAHAPAAAAWRACGMVRHVFSHFVLELQVWRAEGAAPGRAIAREAAHDAAFPSVMRKVLRLAGV